MRDPFNDLHHNECGASSHIRLISEGGSSHAGSPQVVCIDSIQATHTCTTESQHTVYRSATACSVAAPRETSLCWVQAALAGELDQGVIPRVLRHRLQLAGVPLLAAAARVNVRAPGRLWYISDEGRTFTLRRIAARIAVYLEL